MKKTLVAVAALAASAAFAQSSVTLYGVADAYFGSQKDWTQERQTVVNSGGLSESRIGVSVKEDLGADLSAFAVFEQGLNLDKGQGGNTRKSVVGLGGSFGALSLGAQRTPLHNTIEGVIDNQANSAFGAVGSVLAGDATDANYAISYTDSIRYDSPNFEGFSGSIQVGLGENKDRALNLSADRGVSFNLTYENGPLAVAYAHQNDKAVVERDPADPFFGLTGKLKTNAFGASYDFGIAKANVGYIQQKATLTGFAGADKFRIVNFGAVVPFDAFSLVAQVAQGKENGVKGNARSFALEGRYALSKRTTTYVGLNQTRDTIGTTTVKAPSTKTNRFGVGVRHVF